MQIYILFARNLINMISPWETMIYVKYYLFSYKYLSSIYVNHILLFLKEITDYVWEED